MDFHHLAKPKNVSVDSKCDVLLVTACCLWYARLSQEKYRLEFCISWWNCMLQPYIESATALSNVCMCPCYIRINILLLGGTGTRVSLSNSYQNTWQLCSHSCLHVHFLHMFCVKRDESSVCNAMYENKIYSSSLHILERDVVKINQMILHLLLFEGILEIVLRCMAHRCQDFSLIGKVYSACK